jgi:aspartyl-tRNA(Asn)/glutamyl-tRNA(Gln) amidotransferase subunit A
MAAPSFPEDIFFLSLTELGKKLRAKEFKAEELTRAWAERLEKLGPRYNALALSLREPAIKAAKEVDDDIKRDRWRGPLQGIPFGVKDLLAVKGHPTTWGAKPFAGQVFDEDAQVVKKLTKAGGILTGKLAMVELAGGPNYRYASASLTGPGLNPWDRGCWAGGSSSGSGAAVAAGLVPYAIGTETWGSILCPSAYCGVTGLRPSYGLVSRSGAMALSWTMDKIGPMARSAEDCAIVLQAIAGGDGTDPGSSGKSYYFAPQFARPLENIRVGYAPVDFYEWADPSARPAFDEALKAVKAMGMPMKELTLPDLPYGAIATTIIAAEAASIFEDLVKTNQVDQLADQFQAQQLREAMGTPAVEYLRAMRLRRVVQDEMRKLFLDYDVFLTPSILTPATKLDQRVDVETPPNPLPASKGLTGLMAAGNLTGMPAISLPCGFAGKLPVAISFVSRPFTEHLLVTLGMEYQKRTDWHKRRPPVS